MDFKKKEVHYAAKGMAKAKRIENLEVWSKPRQQPAGQRNRDLLLDKVQRLEEELADLKRRFPTGGSTA